MDDHRDNVWGQLYLIHFKQPLGDPSRPHMSARHYLGWTGDVKARIDRHTAGNGSSIMKAVKAKGIEHELVWVRFGTRNEERRLKRNGHFTDRLCDICKGERHAS